VAMEFNLQNKKCQQLTRKFGIKKIVKIME
jgi:outer membrane protein OmpU